MRYRRSIASAAEERLERPQCLPRAHHEDHARGVPVEPVHDPDIPPRPAPGSARGTARPARAACRARAPASAALTGRPACRRSGCTGPGRGPGSAGPPFPAAAGWGHRRSRRPARPPGWGRGTSARPGPPARAAPRPGRHDATGQNAPTPACPAASRVCLIRFTAIARRSPGLRAFPHRFSANRCGTARSRESRSTADPRVAPRGEGLGRGSSRRPSSNWRTSSGSRGELRSRSRPIRDQSISPRGPDDVAESDEPESRSSRCRFRSKSRSLGTTEEFLFHPGGKGDGTR